MATKQKSRTRTTGSGSRSGAASRRGSGQSSTRARSGPRSTAKSSAGKRKAKPKGAARSATAPVRSVGTAFEGHAHDVAGLGLGAVAAVAGLGIYGDLAGPVGEGLAELIGWAVGRADVLVPPLFALVGLRFLRGSREGDRPVARLVVGGLLLAVALCGLLAVVGDDPGLEGTRAELAEAGGVVGALVGGPLAALFGPWAAGVVLVVVGVLGLVVLTGVPLRVVGEHVGSAAGWVRSALGRAFGALFHIGSDRLVADEPGDGVRPRAGVGGFDSPTVLVAGDDDPPEDPGLISGDDHDAAASVDPSPEVVVPEVHVPGPEDESGPAEQLEMDLGPAVKRSPWKLPPRKLLERSEAQEVDRRLVEEAGHRLEQALAAHGVETRLVGMVVGPTVTRFELELGAGVKVAKVTSLHKDIAYAMASPDVRILAPIPGRQAIGIEVPNVRRQVVALGDILASEEARRAKNPLEVAIGRDINGRSILVDLATMPHVLIAGATGAGKSSCINSLITSVLMRTTPDQVRMILVDPKRVELGQYNRLPHLLTQVVTNPKKAANALAWAVREMERRYDLLSEVGFRDIGGYNAAYDRGDLTPQPDDLDAVEYQRLPYILVVVDELNDLMMVAARDVEESICRIAQMARAVGIHLVIATQRPSVNVITGVIKANVPARLAFAVSSLADSRVILDQGGAERLVGKGDLLLLGPSSSVPQRIQGCWVSEKEVRDVVGHWRRQSPEVAYVEGVEGSDDDPSVGGVGGDGDDDDDLLAQAMELVVRSQLGSTSMLQRKLRVGFARAGRLMDLLEQRGVVGPSEGSKARAVMMSVEELENLLESGSV